MLTKGVAASHRRRVMVGLGRDVLRMKMLLLLRRRSGSILLLLLMVVM